MHQLLDNPATEAKKNVKDELSSLQSNSEIRAKGICSSRHAISSDFKECATVFFHEDTKNGNNKAYS